MGFALPERAAGALDASLFLPCLLASGVLAPICEELFFRGYLMGVFTRYGRGRAVLSSALLFSLAHGVDMAFLPRVLIGALLGDAMARTGSILAPMLLHGCYNIAIILINFSGASDLFTGYSMLSCAVRLMGTALCWGAYARVCRARPTRVGGGNPNRQMEEKGDCAAGGGGACDGCRGYDDGGDEAVNMALICMGRLKERYWRDAADEYEKRLSRFGRFEEIELADLPEPANSSPAIEAQICEREGKAILQKVREGDIVIALCIGGKQLDSVQLSQALTRYGDTGRRVVFIIGGSLGLSPQVIARADFKLSFSPMTFPHQLARVMLLEQTYRAMKIAAGERYHK